MRPRIERAREREILRILAGLFWRLVPHVCVFESARGGKVHGLPVHALACKCGKVRYCGVAGKAGGHGIAHWCNIWAEQHSR